MTTQIIMTENIEQKPHKKIKKKHVKICFSCIFMLLFALVIVYSVKSFFAPAGETVLFEIAPGTTGRGVAHELKESKLIKSEFFFLTVLRLTAGAQGLKAGKFVLNDNMNTISIISCITSNRCNFLKKVTIKEGLRLEEVGAVMSENFITSAEEFIKLAKAQNLEGYLYPSTYLFAEDVGPQKAINTMTDEFNRRVRPLLPKDGYWLSERQILTIASIVEREAVLDVERPKIAAVYINRFKIGMKLQADPTVQYAFGYDMREHKYWKKNLTLSDLRKTDSPYNTYMYPGLPPGPICSPSLSSVLAVLNPEPDFKALYFVADNVTGGHIFTETYNQHVKAIRSVRGK